MTWTPGPWRWETKRTWSLFEEWGTLLWAGDRSHHDEVLWAVDVDLCLAAKPEDARLISLAPEMAELLERLADECEIHHNAIWKQEDGTVSRPCGPVDDAHDLLRRARGEA